MLNLVLGFSSRDRRAEPQVLYLGHDGGAARKALNTPPDGVVRTQLSLPTPHKNRYFQTKEEVAKAEAAKAEAQKELEKSEEPPEKSEEPPKKSEKSQGSGPKSSSKK